VSLVEYGKLHQWCRLLHLAIAPLAQLLHQWRRLLHLAIAPLAQLLHQWRRLLHLAIAPLAQTGIRSGKELWRESVGRATKGYWVWGRNLSHGGNESGSLSPALGNFCNCSMKIMHF